MKKLTIQFLGLAMIIIVFSVTDSFAQRISFSGGSAKVSTKIGADSSKTFTVSGKDFGKMTIKQTNRGQFKYEIRRGSSILSSGHTTGSNIRVKSDGKSTYRITIINEENAARRIVLQFSTNSAGSGKQV